MFVFQSGVTKRSETLTRYFLPTERNQSQIMIQLRRSVTAAAAALVRFQPGLVQWEVSVCRLVRVVDVGFIARCTNSNLLN